MRQEALRAAGALAALAWLWAPPRPAAAQPLAGLAAEEVVYRSGLFREAPAIHQPLVRGAARYVVVHLAQNRVYVFEGERAIWAAPAGTGTGFRLQSGERRWRFSTPRGLMQVRRMEKDPLWEAPDWYYVERGLRPPPPNHPSRTMEGVMGTTAIFLGDGIAIHGTNRPELLMDPDPEARRVSHGCIRLTNEHARELMHMIEVGTLVLIY